MKKEERRAKAAAVLNILIIAWAVIGTILMLFFRDGDALLASSGVENLKYFTVLSNEFCGIVAVFDGSVLRFFPAPTLRKKAKRIFFHAILYYHKGG